LFTDGEFVAVDAAGDAYLGVYYAETNRLESI